MTDGGPTKGDTCRDTGKMNVRRGCHLAAHIRSYGSCAGPLVLLGRIATSHTQCLPFQNLYHMSNLRMLQSCLVTESAYHVVLHLIFVLKHGVRQRATCVGRSAQAIV